jgi:CHRD domain-containing protein/PEP-CTERM motif-containing protein
VKRVLSALAFVLLVSRVSFASPITFAGVISGANENPATGSPGTGSAVVTYDSSTHLLTVDAAFSGLEANTTAAHIHCCIAPPGNTGVATTTPSFVGFPLGVTSGTFVSTLDLTLASSFNPAFITANGGTVSGAEAAFAAGLESDMAYFNIHTTAFPSGEVRAFLAAVPEPDSIVLALAGLSGLALVHRVRRRSS